MGSVLPEDWDGEVQDGGGRRTLPRYHLGPMSDHTTTTSSAPPGGVAPHPILVEHYAEPDARKPYLTDLFDSSAQHYDWINTVLSFGTGVRYRRQALLRAGLEPGMQMLDVACGTGVISEIGASIVGPAGTVTSVDPSQGMREQARERRGIEAIAGAAESLPLDDASIDFLVMGYALRHVTDLDTAFAEYARVLRPGGRLLLLEITSPESRIRKAAVRFYFRSLIPAIMRIGSRDKKAHELMVYHWDSIEQCVRPEVIIDALGATGFDGIDRHVEVGMFSEYTARRPETK